LDSNRKFFEKHLNGKFMIKIRNEYLCWKYLFKKVRIDFFNEPKFLIIREWILWNDFERIFVW
jgi:hypothetical protein